MANTVNKPCGCACHRPLKRYDVDTATGQPVRADTTLPGHDRGCSDCANRHEEQKTVSIAKPSPGIRLSKEAIKREIEARGWRESSSGLSANRIENGRELPNLYRHWFVKGDYTAEGQGHSAAESLGAVLEAIKKFEDAEQGASL